MNLIVLELWLKPTVGGSESQVELSSTPSFVLHN
jgi:hypothetical protein